MGSNSAEGAWFAGLDPTDSNTAIERIRTGSADNPDQWPTLAISTDFVPDEASYFERLHEVACEATREAVILQERADDRQVIHAIRTIDDLDRVTNELSERLTEWARTTSLDVDQGRNGVRSIADGTPDTLIETEIVGLSRETVALQDRRNALVETVDRLMHSIAPNLTALAGSLLGARLLALAGSLEQLAKMPSSTVQVLGAEDALFAHLRGDAPSPKHGIIFTHEFVRGTPQEHRGSAARAVAGKLSIAARIDHYAGDLRPDLERELRERMQRIRERSP